MSTREKKQKPQYFLVPLLRAHSQNVNKKDDEDVYSIRMWMMILIMIIINN